jgi:hypothetical protein
MWPMFAVGGFHCDDKGEREKTRMGTLTQEVQAYDEPTAGRVPVDKKR